MDYDDGPVGSGDDPRTYGASFADVYDDWYGDITDARATARFVAERCGYGPVLELGVGTGRLARPLLDEGLDVIGLDVSGPMLAHCVDPARGRRVPVVQADMAALPLRGPLGAVLIAFNTLFNLASASAQRRLLFALAPLLAADGVLVVETMDTDALADGPRRSVAPSRLHHDGVTVVATVLDPVDQTIVGRHIDLRDGGVRFRPWSLRWSRAEEIDRWATEAGLVLTERLAGWRAGVDAGSDASGPGGAVSVYRLRGQ